MGYFAIAPEMFARQGDVSRMTDMPPEMVMGAEPMVDAALRGFDRGELITVPSLHSEAALQAYETARAALLPQLSANTPAPRYQAAD